MLLHALLGIAQLLVAERDATHVGAKFFATELGQCPPAATNFQHAVSTPNARHVQGASNFCILRSAHVLRAIVAEPGGRIVHRTVQPQPIKIIAQIVVGMDILATS